MSEEPQREVSMGKMKSMRSKEERVVINWHNLTFQTVLKDPSKSTPFKNVYKTKSILNGLNGSAASGELLAILGPTGCGKTSLLNVLAARIPHGGSSANKLTGTIIVNGKPRQEEKFRNISAYVLQDDFMYAYLTVFETLMLAAHFFLPVSVTEEEKVAQVEACIAELGLVKARDTFIGNDKVRGVSGGERRRASIAVQLLTDPAVLFLDEVRKPCYFLSLHLFNACLLVADVRIGRFPIASSYGGNEEPCPKRKAGYGCHSSTPLEYIRNV